MSSSETMEEDVVVRGKTQRILAFDLIRGFFLVVIMIDHVELYPNGFDFFTGKGRLWVSAAEGFFFLSGLLIGMMYKRRLHLGMKFIFKKMWTRAAELYIVGTGLTLLYLAWAVFSHHPTIKDSLPIPFPWHHYLGQIFLMRFTYGWADFLVRFALLMLIAPFVFYIVSKGWWKLALIGIFVAWLFRGQGFTLSWQLIFNTGILAGFYWNELRSWLAQLSFKHRRLLKWSIASIAVITFAISYASVFVLSLLFNLWGNGQLPVVLQHVAYDWGNWNHDIWNIADKWTMGPVRAALFFFWFTTFYWLVRRYEQPVGRFTRGILELLGRNSLFVYTVHSLIIFILKLYIIPPKTGLLQNFFITGFGLVLLVAITRIYKKVEPSLETLSLARLKLLLSGAKS